MAEHIAPVLSEVMNIVLREGKIPNTWKEAYIRLIPKKEAEILDIKNFRPISLLINDYKLFADILADWVKKVLSRIIHKDQAGFFTKKTIEGQCEKYCRCNRIFGSKE